MPDWVAVIVQLPKPVGCTKFAATRQAPLASYETTNPELAVADVWKTSPKVRLASEPNVMLWAR